MNVLLIFKDSVATERMAIMQISSALKKSNHSVMLWIMSRNEPAKLHEIMRNFKPKVIGYSAMTGEHIPLAKLNLELKKQYDFYTVFGGPHATFCPDFIEEDGIDAICTGEGDIVFPEFCRRMEKGEEYWLTSTFHVNHEGKCYKNSLNRLIPELADLDFPDRKLLYDADPIMASLGTKYFLAARGCPYKCSYCFNVNYNKSYKNKGKIIRSRTPEQVIEEIEWVQEHYPLDHVSFLDDLFILKPSRWLEEFAKIYKERIDLPWSCTVRANIVKENVIAMLKDCGLTWVWMGVECGDEDIANKILARGLSNEQIIAAARVLQKHDVGLIAQNLIGLPVPNPVETDLKTLDLNIELAPSMGWSSILYPYPGVPIESYATKHGYMGDTPLYMETNKRSSMLKFSSDMERRKIENLHKIFGIIVRFPFLRPYAEFLASLPFSTLYRAIFYLWYGYCFKIKLTKIKSYRKELPYFVGLFFRMLGKS
jgi:radical SAM superfamily enzyme YgiQ (UPF0313 family)